MRCIGVECPEEGEANSVCAEFRCRNFKPNVFPPEHEDPSPIFVCPVHLSQAIETLQVTGRMAFFCHICQRPWSITIST